MVRRTLVVLVLAIVLAAIATLTLRALLDEPNARRVDSLAAFTQSRVVLGVFAHPDDEILVTSVLADAARRGCIVFTVTATRGEQGMPQDFRGDVAELKRRREAELRSFGARIGIREQTLWEFKDGALEQDDALVDSIAAAVRRVRPDLVVTFDSSMGGTGHADHRRVGAAVLRVLDAEGEDAWPRWLARVVVPHRAAALMPEAELRRRIRHQPPADVAIPVDARAKLLGMRTHATQARYLPPAWIRPLGLGIWDHEFYALTRVR